MKDHVEIAEIGHLTKYDAFRVNRDQVKDLETWFKIRTNVSNFGTASPKTYSASQSLGPESRNAPRPHAAASNRHTFLSRK